ncbi:type IV pilus biogenesis protein PilP [Serratia quinivorans]|uniref:type IV pilus biogenesis protein PilP n=1 Tax=Serratia TaxID=613 RepID=UPI001F4C1174|nr:MULTISPECIES: type IV pilus biogenesis protein PilP [Serratia]ULG13341.1 PilP [Serratia proteamaculans]ULG13451.1 PilP [Serratia proteamaculans]ULG13554.1 PilP [Serratia proteamaculans]ULG13781.1 PilP [Serratia proteamaculans]ULG13923.1 PilP [Serratia proteamaculans]
MPTVKSWLTPWALCLALAAPGVFAAPVADIPAAPPAIPSAEPSVKPITSEDIPLPTTFTRTEAGRALNLGQLEAIQAETVLYEAQLARAKAFNELQKNGYDRGLSQPFNPAPPSQDNKTEIKGAAQDTVPPQIVEITGTGKGFTAVLALSNGNQVTVQSGNRIPGTEYVVKRINLNEVVITGKNQSLVSLSFAG